MYTIRGCKEVCFPASLWCLVFPSMATEATDPEATPKPAAGAGAELASGEWRVPKCRRSQRRVQRVQPRQVRTAGDLEGNRKRRREKLSFKTLLAPKAGFIRFHLWIPTLWISELWTEKPQVSDLFTPSCF